MPIPSKRIALVIGNSEYRYGRKLDNPGNDARDIAAALTRIGFADADGTSAVQPKLDLDVDAMRSEFEKFQSAGNTADQCILFYAGHGVEYQQKNFLLPIECRLENATHLEDLALALSDIMTAMAEQRGLRLIILDACRNDPFPANRSMTGLGRGLAEVTPAGQHMVVAYAARAGSVAQDGGPGANSPYTAAIRKHLETPGLEVLQLFREITTEVRRATDNEQEPHVYHNLGRDPIYLAVPKVSDDAGATFAAWSTAIQAIAQPIIQRAGENLRPVLHALMERALAAVSRGVEASEAELNDLVDLQLRIEDESTEAVRVGGFVTLLNLNSLRERLEALGKRGGAPEELDHPTLELLELAQKKIDDELRNNQATPAKEALLGLKNLVDAAVCEGRVRFGRLSERVELVHRADRQCLHAGRRAIQFALGLNASRLPPLSVFRERLSGVFVGPEMVVIPSCPNGFLAGADEKIEGNRISIPLKFAMARFALTFDEYAAFCNAKDRDLPPDEGWGTANRPVINVTWHNAVAYCDWLNAQIPSDGGAAALYRLPFEAEWEYACRGDETGENRTSFSPEVARLHKGHTIEPGEANFDGNFTHKGSSQGAYRKMTVPVDHPKFHANGFGLVQMHGNVWEWCADSYAGTISELPENVQSFTGKRKKGDSVRLVRRGGAWNNVPRVLRSAYRSGWKPDFRGSYMGFRIARSL